MDFAKKSLTVRLAVVSAALSIFAFGCNGSNESVQGTVESSSTSTVASTSLFQIVTTLPTTTTSSDKPIENSDSTEEMKLEDSEVSIEENGISGNVASTSDQITTLSVSGYVYFAAGYKPFNPDDVVVNAEFDRIFLTGGRKFPGPPDNSKYNLIFENKEKNVIKKIPINVLCDHSDYFDDRVGQALETLTQSMFPTRCFFLSFVANPPEYNSIAIQVDNNVNSASESIANDNNVFGKIYISDNAPTASIDTPEVGQTFEGDKVELSWIGSDADGDTLTYRVFYSANDGESYDVVELDTTETSLTLDRSILPGSDNARFKVSVSDGARSTYSESPAFSVKANPPSVRIITPSDNGIFVGRQGFLLNASGYDREDSILPSSAFQWHSSIDGELGQGNNISLSAEELTPGTHDITVKATDTSGMVATATHNIEIKAISEIPVEATLPTTTTANDKPIENSDSSEKMKLEDSEISIEENDLTENAASTSDLIPTLSVSGYVYFAAGYKPFNPDDVVVNAEFDEIFLTGRKIFPDHPDNSKYNLVFQSKENNVIKKVPINVWCGHSDYFDDGEGQALETLMQSMFPTRCSFLFFVSNPPEYHSLAIQVDDNGNSAGESVANDSNLFGKIDKSKNVPTVSVLTPKAGQILSDKIAEISWTGYDMDDDNLVYRVLFSGDGGKNYNIVKLETENTSISFEKRYFFHDTDQGRLMISVSDGTQSIYVESEIFSVTNTASVNILQLEDGASYGRGHFFTLVAAVTGYEYGEELNFVWHSSLSGLLGSVTGKPSVGELIADLEWGEQTITVTVSDDSGNSASDSVTINVVSDIE